MVSRAFAGKVSLVLSRLSERSTVSVGAQLEQTTRVQVDVVDHTPPGTT
jgi:hypothetical protein